MNITYKEEYLHEHGFAEYFENELIPLLEKVERHRKATLKQFLFIGSLCILACIIIPLGVVQLFDDYELIFVSFIFCAIVSGLILLHIRKSFKNVAITKVNEILVKFFGEFNYKRDYHISEDILDDVEFILPDYDRIYCEDYIHGKYENNKIEFCEARIEEEYEDSDGDSHYKTVFKGIFVILTFNRNFSGKTFIIKDKGKILNFFKKASTSLTRIELENKEFDKHYEVYSTNQIETQSILSTEFQKQIIQLAKSFHCESINCCLYQNKAFFAIPINRNLFESISLFQSAYDTSRFKKFLQDFYLVLTISDKISEKLFNETQNVSGQIE
ncbi:MAG: DUF3137 domain-containing protein [Vampirovibrionia bacterium]